VIYPSSFPEKLPGIHPGPLASGYAAGAAHPIGNSRRKMNCVVAFTTNNISLPERSTKKQESSREPETR
jgi:hypothetical protein